MSPTHFVTLATNDPTVRSERMRRLLREWDARVNRELLGPHWLKKPDERILWGGFIEKPRSNPHWHLVVQVLDDQRMAFEESNLLDRHWRRLISTGSVRFDRIRDGGAIRYATKDLGQPGNWETFVHSREFLPQ